MDEAFGWMVTRWFLILATTAGGAVAGAAFQYAGAPLPWILGPLIATAIASIAGLQLEIPAGVRRTGQVVIGANVGLSFSAQILERVVGWFPLMVGVALLAVAIGAVLSIPFGRLSRTDRKTAFFAMMPGGVAEMANIGAAAGAAAAPIALVQTIRVALVVCLIPPLVTAMNVGPAASAGQVPATLDALHTAIAVAAALVGSLVVGLLRVNNPWLIGAVVGTAVLAVAGWVHGRLPVLLYDLGQILVGISIGAQFKRDIVVSMARIVLAAIASLLAFSVLLILLARLIVLWMPIDHGTAILSTAAGGMAEMSATAIALHSDVALVAAFHFVRVFIINGFALYFWSLTAWVTRQR